MTDERIRERAQDENRCEKCYFLGCPCAGYGVCRCPCHKAPKKADSADEAFWKYLDENSATVRRWPRWMHGDYSELPHIEITKRSRVAAQGEK